MSKPSSYTPEIGEEICQRLAQGESLRSICDSQGMPYRRTVRGWVADDVEGFGAQYARAKEAQAHALAEDLLEIADAATNEDYQVARLRVDTRKWLASKILPKSYGDKVEAEVYGKDGAPLVPTLSVTVRRE